MSLEEEREPKTTLASTHAVALALEMEGIDSKALFKEAGIPYHFCSDPSNQLPTRKQTKMYGLAVRETGNPAFGLKVATFMQPSVLHALGYSILSSATLMDFCKRLERFFVLVSDNARHTLEASGNHYKLYITKANDILSYEAMDAWIAYLTLTCRNLYRPDFSPLQIDLSRPRPEIHSEDFESFFKAPVNFSQEHNILYFSTEDMTAPLPMADAELARRNDEVVIEHLARREKSDILRKVEAKIVDLLPSGECTKERVASELNLSLSNLYNKLEQRGTSYQNVLEDLRSTLACQYLQQPNMPITQITYLLGFSDTSNFSRAFRRWTGKSPSQYRKELNANT
jgi:AraC-like DNA-binding protein